MTRVEIFKKNGSVCRVICDGHTGYGVEGEDIVCAALSSVVQTAVLGLVQVVGINISLKRDDLAGFLEFSIPDDCSAPSRRDADIVLNTMLCGISDLSDGFSDFIELEVH